MHPIKELSSSSSEDEIKSYLLNKDQYSIPLRDAGSDLENYVEDVFVEYFAELCNSDQIKEAALILEKNINYVSFMEEIGDEFDFEPASYPVLNVINKTKNSRLLDICITSFDFESGSEVLQAAVLNAIESQWLEGYERFRAQVSDNFILYEGDDQYDSSDLDVDSISKATYLNNVEITKKIVESGIQTVSPIITQSINSNSLQVYELLQATLLKNIATSATEAALAISMKDDSIFELYLNSSNPEFKDINPNSITLANLKKNNTLGPIPLDQLLQESIESDQPKKLIACLKSDYEFTFMDLTETFENANFVNNPKLADILFHRLYPHSEAFDNYLAKYNQTGGTISDKNIYKGEN